MFTRRQHSEDAVWLQPSMAAVAYEGLAVTGFAASSDVLEDVDVDADDSECLALARLGLRAASVRLWSKDRHTGSSMGFECLIHRCEGVFYATPAVGDTAECDEGLPRGFGADRAMKGAIVALLDVAESCNTHRITLVLRAEHAGHAEFLCSLLYVGFQVVPARAAPFLDVALMLDLDIAWPSQSPRSSPSNSDCTSTSTCSTSADEVEGDEGTDSPDSRRSRGGWG